MKKMVLCFLLVLALCLPLAASAEVTFEMIYQYVPRITVVAGTNYVIMSSGENGLYGVNTTDGKEVIPYQYKSLSNIGNLFLADTNAEIELNNKAIVYIDGRQISDYDYGSFKAYSQHWIAGYILSEATEDSYDVKLSNKFYHIDHTDLFYVDDEVQDSYQVASLEGQPLANTYLHGEYITVQDAAENVTVYDKHFQPTGYAVEGLKSAIYGVNNYNVTNLITGEVVAQGYTAVSESSGADRLRLIVHRYHWDGSRISGVIDTKGNEIIPVEYTISSVTPQYAVITNAEKLKGLYSIESGEIIVPCEFNNILVGKNATDTYVMNGYVLVEKDGLRCYYDIAKGEITCELHYDYDNLTRVGASSYIKTDDGFELIAADGTVTKLDVDSFATTRGDGYLLVAKKGDFFGVIDWHGNEVLPFYHKTAPVITDDSYAIIRSSTGMQMDRIIR